MTSISTIPTNPWPAVTNPWPADVHTLAIDIGGTGFKASVLDEKGAMVVEEVRVATPYPCTPETFLSTILELVKPLPPAHRVTVGFPGLVRNGVVHEVPSLSRRVRNGERDETLAKAWSGYDLRTAIANTMSLPTKVANDADVQGCAVAKGSGLEFVLTLGTGVGTSLFQDGQLLPHLELSHGPFDDTMTTDIALGDFQLRHVGVETWLIRVRKAIAYFDAMLIFDHLYIGGGNARLLSRDDIGPKGSLVSNENGILGGIRIWELDA
ncbi:MAG: ROK family protein [Actinomycetota bacterium]|nr:ROK family protein [Actinomycetota bacterium]